MDPIGLLQSIARILLTPVLWPAKTIQAWLTDIETHRNRLHQSRKRYEFIRDVVGEFGFGNDGGTGTESRKLTSEELMYLAPIHAALTEAIVFLYHAESYLALGHKARVLLSLDNVERRLRTAVRCGTTALMSGQMRYRGHWRPAKDWNASMALDTDGVPPLDERVATHNAWERFAFVAAVELFKGMKSATDGSNHEAAQLTDHINRLMARRVS